MPVLKIEAVHLNRRPLPKTLHGTITKKTTIKPFRFIVFEDLTVEFIGYNAVLFVVNQPMIRSNKEETCFSETSVDFQRTTQKT
jgi:hypothetical protein